jgi:hypothetical protein
VQDILVLCAQVDTEPPLSASIAELATTDTPARHVSISYPLRVGRYSHSPHTITVLSFLHHHITYWTLPPLLVLSKVKKTPVECDILSGFFGAFAAKVSLGFAFLACLSRALGAGPDLLGTLGHGDEGRAGFDTAVECVLTGDAGELVKLGFVDGQMLLSFVGSGGYFPYYVDVDVDVDVLTTAQWLKAKPLLAGRFGEFLFKARLAPYVYAWKRVVGVGEVKADDTAAQWRCR